MIITEIPHFSSKIIRFQVTLKSAVEFTCALEFKISSQQIVQKTVPSQDSLQAVSWRLHAKRSL